MRHVLNKGLSPAILLSFATFSASNSTSAPAACLPLRPPAFLGFGGPGPFAVVLFAVLPLGARVFLGPGAAFVLRFAGVLAGGFGAPSSSSASSSVGAGSESSLNASSLSFSSSSVASDRLRLLRRELLTATPVRLRHARTGMIGAYLIQIASPASSPAEICGVLGRRPWWRLGGGRGGGGCGQDALAPRATCRPSDAPRDPSLSSARSADNASCLPSCSHFALSTTSY